MTDKELLFESESRYIYVKENTECFMFSIIEIYFLVLVKMFYNLKEVSRKEMTALRKIFRK